MKRKLLLMTALLVGAISVNAQKAWHIQNANFTVASRGINDFDVVDSNVVWAPAYDGSGGNAVIRNFTKTVDGGATWKSFNIVATGLTATYGLANISAIDKDTAYASIYPTTAAFAAQGVYKTTDGGNTWKKVSTGAFTNASSFINVVHFFDAKNGIAMGDPANGYFELWTTSNYGNSWTRVAQNSIPLTPIAGEYGTVGYYGGIDSTVIYPTNFGNILVSKDFGMTWAAATTSLSGVANTFIPTITAKSKNEFWAVIGNSDSVYSRLMFSLDGGLSWNSTGGSDTIGEILYLSSVAYVPGTTGTYFVTSANGTNGIVGSAYTEDGGATWMNIDLGTQHTSCAFADINNGWSGGFWSATNGGIFKWGSVRIASGVNNNKVENFQVYPNPSNGTFYVRANVKGASSIRVMDVTGRVVFQKEYPTQSLLLTSLDLTNQAQGVYMVEVKEGNNVSVQKIVKQ